MNDDDEYKDEYNDKYHPYHKGLSVGMSDNHPFQMTRQIHDQPIVVQDPNSAVDSDR